VHVTCLVVTAVAQSRGGKNGSREDKQRAGKARTALMSREDMVRGGKNGSRVD
jgi:hypothetical protein